MKLNLQTVSETLPVQEQIRLRKENILSINKVMRSTHQSRLIEFSKLRNVEVYELLMLSDRLDSEAEKQLIYHWIMYYTAGYQVFKILNKDGMILSETADLNHAVEAAFDLLNGEPTNEGYKMVVGHIGTEIPLKQWYSDEVQKETVMSCSLIDKEGY
jgi:hypothetical protein